MTTSSKELSGKPEFPVEIPQQCRNCIMIARAALAYEDLGKKIQAVRKEDASGALLQRWVAHTASVGEMSLAEAEALVESEEPRLRAEFEEKVEGLASTRDAKVSFARYIVEHCERGVVRLISPMEGVGIEAEVCGSTTPERVHGVNDAEIVRVRRQPVAADVRS